MDIEEPLLRDTRTRATNLLRFFALIHLFSGGRKQRVRRLRWLLVVLSLFVFGLILFLKNNRQSLRLPMPLQHQGDPQFYSMKSTCELDRHIGFVDISFEDPESFALIEDVEYMTCGRNFRNCTMGGLVSVVHVPAKSDTIPNGIPILVRLSVATSFPYNIDELGYMKTRESLTLTRPKLSERKRESIDSWKWKHRYRPGIGPCLHYIVEVKVRNNVTLTNWTTKLRHLNLQSAIEYDPDHPEHPYDSAPPFRVTNTTLYQALYRDSTVTCNSRSTRIESRTGNIQADILFNEDLTIDNWSGAINAKIDDFDVEPLQTNNKRRRTVTTITRSGNTTLNFWERWNKIDSPYLPKNNPQPRVFANHHTTSGKIALKYPAGWYGTIEGLSVYGHIKMRDGTPEADIEQRGDSAYISEVVGNASENDGYVHFSTETGNIDIAMGDGIDWVDANIVMGYDGGES